MEEPRVDSQPQDGRAMLAAAYDAFAGELFRLAAMLLMDASAAEDAVATVFAKLAHMGGRLGEVGSTRAYLRTAVRNECYRLLGQRQSQPAPLDDPGILVAASDEAGLDADERREVQRALAMLPPDQREVVHMKVYEGKTFRQIAEELAISLNTAGSRYRYAIDKLRTLLRQRVEE
jgi:RNA polymerase sigma-70 factor, ECF subfamily